MIDIIDVEEVLTLADYGAVAHLAGAVQRLRAEAELLVPAFRGRTVWMVNSTERGGGVAEMMPRLVSVMRELGIDTRWAVIRTDRPAFFDFTKRLHHLIHGAGDPRITSENRALYDEVSRRCADAMRPELKPKDVVIIHDPQPMGMGALLKRTAELTCIWRCHIGSEERNQATRAAWRFLGPHAAVYDHAVFSAPEYIPDCLAGRSTIIHPAIDPLSHKNRELSPHKLMGILCNAGLARAPAPVLTPPFRQRAQRLQADGSFATATAPEEIGLAYRPTVLQVSRWDRLKGWDGVLNAFVTLKRQARKRRIGDERHQHRLRIVRLILAGPDPASIQDDPEAEQVLDSLKARFLSLEPEIQQDIVLLTLPMASRKENALMVNVLQRCSTVAVQNSIREGFGLTATEAMWKRTAVLGTQASGLRV
ncbi:MAG: glycosyltransferase, partial [Acidobacteriota bacterium]